MKIKLLIVLCISLVVTNCSISNNTETPQNFKNLWHLINVSGGVSGINENFELETIIWSFNEATLKLTIVNNNDDDTIQDGLDSGTYDYAITNANGKSYLIIDGNEVGELTFTQTSMQIDENIMSTGNGADGFMYSFQLQTFLIE